MPAPDLNAPEILPTNVIVDPLSNVPAVKAPVAPVPQPAATTAQAADKASEETPAVLPDDADGDEVQRYTDKDGNVKMPWKAFNTRINRAKKSELKSIFGTDDKEAIKRQKADYEKMLADRETARRAQLDELTRAREDVEKEKKRAEQLARQLEERDFNQQVDTVQRSVEKVAVQHVADEYVDFAVEAFKKELRGMDDDQVDALTDEQVSKWFTDWAAKRTAMARQAPSKQDDKSTQKVVQKITNGTGGGQARPNAGGSANAGEKTARPGQPNSMSNQEIVAKYGRLW